MFVLKQCKQNMAQGKTSTRHFKQKKKKPLNPISVVGGW